MSTRIEEMAKWAHSLGFEKIPARVIERAKYQLINTVAAAHAGAISPAAHKLITAASKWDAGGGFPITATGKKLSLHGALFVNAALSMAHDYDDYLFLGHTGHSAVFASLLVGLSENRSMKEILAAQVLGNEIGGRLGAACLIGPHNGQMWTHIHVAETAAIAAKLMGLDAKGIAHAVAIGFYQPPFALAPGFMGPDTKLLSAAQTSLAGLMAAELAREGFTGPLDVIENPRGFLAQFSYAPLEFMLSGWGKSWVTDSLAYKIVPGCAYIDTCVDAVKMVLEKYKSKMGRDMAPTDVREVEVRASLLTIGMNHLSEEYVGRGDLNPIAINFSIPANVAILILTGDLRVENLDPDWLELHREDIMAFCRRVNLVHDWEMSLGVTEAMNRVLDLSRVVDSVGLAKLMKARRKAAAHFGIGVSLGIRDFIEMRKKAGAKGREYFERMASGAWKRVIGVKGASKAGSAIDLGDCDFSKFTMPFAAEVVVRTTDWKEYSAKQNIPYGGPGQPWEDTVERVRGKFRREAGRNISSTQIDWVVNNLSELENISSIRRLIDNLVPLKEKILEPVFQPVEPEQHIEPVAAPKPKEKEPVAAAKPKEKEPVAAAKPKEKERVAAPTEEDDSILPPINFEPVVTDQRGRSHGDRGSRERGYGERESREGSRSGRDRGESGSSERVERKEREPRHQARSPEKTFEPYIKEEAVKQAPVVEKNTKAKTKSPNVTPRPAAPRSKSPRPPKGAKRKRLQRP